MALWCFSLFNNKAKEIVKNQKNLIQKIQSSTNGEENIVWFHAASLGEFEQGKSVIKRYKKKKKPTKSYLKWNTLKRLIMLQIKVFVFMDVIPAIISMDMKMKRTWR